MKALKISFSLTLIFVLLFSFMIGMVTNLQIRLIKHGLEDEEIKSKFPLKEEKNKIGTEELEKQARVEPKDIEKKMKVERELKRQIKQQKRESEQK